MMAPHQIQNLAVNEFYRAIDTWLEKLFHLIAGSG
jgi:hypothetical protein